MIPLLSAASRPFLFCDDRSGIPHLLPCIVARAFLLFLFLFSFFWPLSQEPSFPFWRVVSCDSPHSSPVHPPSFLLVHIRSLALAQKAPALHYLAPGSQKGKRSREQHAKEKEPRPDHHTGQTAAAGLSFSHSLLHSFCRLRLCLARSFSLSDSFAPLPLFPFPLDFPIFEHHQT